MKRLVILTVLAGLAMPVLAQDFAKERLNKSSRHHEWVVVKNGKREVHCFVVFPEVKDKATTVLIIHENKGLTDWVRSVADQMAAFVFYGPPPEKEGLAKIKCPVYGFYGENDARINASIPKTKTLMKELSKTFEPVVYAGAGHGFMRAGEEPLAMEANRKARNDAWDRLKTLLKKI
jgi:dienelactone hydrolase